MSAAYSPFACAREPLEGPRRRHAGVPREHVCTGDADVREKKKAVIVVVIPHLRSDVAHADAGERGVVHR